MRKFASLMRRADTLRRFESDPIRHSWWTGYIRGLRRAHHGENFGTQAEHELYLNAVDSCSDDRHALGLGYHAGLKLEWSEPDAQ